jgi:type II secretory pathway component PulM
VARERRELDRPLKRIRQLQSRLETLLRDARELRSESIAHTNSVAAVSAELRRKRRRLS